MQKLIMIPKGGTKKEKKQVFFLFLAPPPPPTPQPFTSKETYLYSAIAVGRSSIFLKKPMPDMRTIQKNDCNRVKTMTKPRHVNQGTPSVPFWFVLRPLVPRAKAFSTGLLILELGCLSQLWQLRLDDGRLVL